MWRRRLCRQRSCAASKPPAAKPFRPASSTAPITAILDGSPFEVTTLREDVETFGRKARVAFGRDWKTDAERRDFTINALSVSRTGEIFDYVGGIADIAARRVRFIGEPQRRIEEDYLRILRFFAFTLITAKARRTRQACTPASARAAASNSSRASACAWKC